MDARSRIIEAAVVELKDRGPSQLRLKRVAAEADVSISLINNYFDGRENLIGEAIAQLYPEMVNLILLDFAAVMSEVNSRESFIRALEMWIESTFEPDRLEARAIRIQAIAIAQHNIKAGETVAAVQARVYRTIIDLIQGIADQGLLKEGVDGAIFSWIWISLLFGQVIVEGDDNFNLDRDDLLRALHLVIDALVR